MMKPGYDEASAAKTLVAQWNQFLLVSSVLAGFAFTAALTILGMKEEGQLIDWILCIFICSSIMLLVSTCNLMFLLMATYQAIQYNDEHGWKRFDVQRRKVASVGSVTFFLGAITFIIGMGLAGWLHSLPVGVASALSAGIGLLLVLWAMVGSFD